METKYINAVKELDMAALHMDDLQIKGTGGGFFKGQGGESDASRAYFVTPVGHILTDVWDDIAEQVIDQEPAGEDGVRPKEMLAALDRYYARNGNKYLREHPKDRRHEALQSCVERLYADKTWQDYKLFQREFAGKKQP